MEPTATSPRARLLIALGAAAALIAVVVAVLALGGNDEEPPEFGVASPECLRAWNSDPAATAYGRHNFNFHQYTGALVTYLTDQATTVDKGQGGKCAVIFPSKALDPEPFAAGQTLLRNLWVPISERDGVDLARLAELQADAAAAPNTSIDTTGKLSPV